MIKTRHPYIIDLEASGLQSSSYPIEIGLALEPGRRYCTLIKPAEHWEHWDDDAESVHKISQALLQERGRPVQDVARELNERLSGKVVFSDAWGLDSAWVDSLFFAARIQKTFSVSALETILTEPQIECWKDARDAVIQDLGLARHRASNDAWIIQETYLRTLAMTS